MLRKKSATSLRKFTEINLTPLVDLTFILLVTFIITFPIIKEEQAISVNLPKANAKKVPEGEVRTISVDKSGSVFLDKQSVTLDSLTIQMKKIGASASVPTVLVRADDGVKYGSVVKVMKVLHEANITKMALVTEAEDK